MSGPDSFWSLGSAVPGEPVGARLPGDLKPGDRVGGRYLVHEVLGRGAFATVYAGEESSTGRAVALKVLESVQPEARARLLREARLLARLRHPALLRIHDALEHAGRLVLVLERVDGPTLEQRLDRLAPDEGLALLEQVARALGEAHRSGVVHRDVKPNNVLLADDGPRLADFGLARAQQGASLTQTGALIGTPRYMAPEQLLGGEVGPPADVWALGVILFRLLSGQLPFRAPNLQAQADLVRKGAPRLVSLGVEVAPELDAVCQRALDPDPSRRFPDGEAFAGALALARGQRAVPASVGSSQVGLGIGLVLLAAALGAGASLVRGVAGDAAARDPGSTPEPATSTSEPATSAPSPTASGADHRALAEAAWRRGDLDQAITLVTRAIELDPGGGRFADFSARLLLHFRAGDHAAARADALRALAREEQGGVLERINLGVALAGLEDFELALGLAERVLAQVEHPRALYLRAQCRDELRLPGAEADLTRALELTPGDAMLRYLRGAIRLEEGRADEALADLERVQPEDFYREPWEQALAKARRLASRTPESATPTPALATPTPEPSSTASGPDHRELAEAAWRRGDLDQARIHVGRAIEQDPGGGTFEDYSARSYLRLEAGDREGARADALRALELAEPDVSSHERLELARTLFSLEEVEAALGVVDLLLESPESPRLQRAEFHAFRGMCLGRLGAPGAEAAYGRALALAPDHAGYRYMRGEFLLNAGRAQEALRDLEQVVPEPEFQERWARSLAEARRQVEAER